MDGFIEVDWKVLKKNMELKKIVSMLQWLENDESYVLYLFDGPMKLKCSIKKTIPKNYNQQDFESNYKTISNIVLDPKDSENSSLNRPKITKPGWSFQLHSVGIDTGKLGGVHNKKINPIDLTIDDLKWDNDDKFASIDLYDMNKNKITDSELENSSHYTIIDWAVDHEIEIIGATFTQSVPPTNNIWMWVFGAPGIANIDFSNGGVNLSRLGVGRDVNADGKAAKYVHPLLPVKGVNKFRILFYHPVYEVHPCQLIFNFFKPNTNL